MAACQTCAAPVQRVFHPIAVHFKGSGFYSTDYGSKKRKRESEQSAKDGADKHDAKQKAKETKSSDGAATGASPRSRRTDHRSRASRQETVIVVGLDAGRVAPMTARQATLMGVLAALWGASYLLIKIALEGFSPAAMIVLRTALGAAVVLLGLIAPMDPDSRAAVAPSCATGRARRCCSPRWPSRCPFLLIAVGEQHVPSGLTAVLIASAPLFVAVFAPVLDPSERSAAARPPACCSASSASRCSSASSRSQRSPSCSARWRCSPRRPATRSSSFMVKRSLRRLPGAADVARLGRGDAC